MSSKLEREIEDLLAKLDSLPRRRSPWSRVKSALLTPLQGLSHAVKGLSLPHIKAGHLLLLAMAIIVIAYLVPSNDSVARLFIIAGIALFAVAFIASLRRQSRPPEKRWRGEVLDLHRHRAGGSGGLWGRWRKR